jgi:hypothetical protein
LDEFTRGLDRAALTVNTVLGVDDEGALSGSRILVGRVLVHTSRTEPLLWSSKLCDGRVGRILFEVWFDDEMRGLIVVVAGTRARQRRQQIKAQLVVGLRIGDLAVALGWLRSSRVGCVVTQRPVS